MSAASAIGDYAVIGDCRSAALVSRGGSIDWLCWPAFDSPSIFGALLGRDAGHWRIAPTTAFTTQRRYLDATNVLETRFAIDGATMRVVDLMPVASESDKRRLMLADHELLRVVECERGEVELETEIAPRPDYGRATPRVIDGGRLGFRFDLGAAVLVLRTDMALEHRDDGRLVGRARLRAGERLAFSLVFEHEWPAVLPPLGQWSHDCVARSIAWWRCWAARMRYDGPCRDEVLRSALALRLLVYAPSAAIVAAPTTSLPERLGGSLNWDYRFCWLRDASLTVRALVGLGYHAEAEAFVGWLVHTTRLTRPELRILYDVFGRRPARERVLDHLPGHAGSRPVRIGNAAAAQLQLDVYGEVIDAVAHLVRTGIRLDRETQRLLCGFGRQVCRTWQTPDEGIWEPRSGRRHNTHSRVLCWVALDRLVDLAAHGHIPAHDADVFAQTRERIRSQVRGRAWNPSLGSYVSALDGDALDASALLMPWYGFEDAASERMRGTYARVRQTLGARDGLLHRYRTEESPGEGAFGVCSFWGAEYLALGGGTAEAAEAALRRLLAFANDVGLFAEEIDPATGAALGNFPQAFTHVGLINAALSLEQRLAGRRAIERDVRPAHDVAAEARP